MATSAKPSAPHSCKAHALYGTDFAGRQGCQNMVHPMALCRSPAKRAENRSAPLIFRWFEKKTFRQTAFSLGRILSAMQRVIRLRPEPGLEAATNVGWEVYTCDQGEPTSGFKRCWGPTVCRAMNVLATGSMRLSPWDFSAARLLGFKATPREPTSQRVRGFADQQHRSLGPAALNF